MADGKSDKSKTVALLLCFFIGILGVHRFYVGKIGTGVLQLVTLGGLGIWALIDMIMIVMQKFTDSEGNTLKFN
jgi:TM2 domain-containing membrane protein YozV